LPQRTVTYRTRGFFFPARSDLHLIGLPLQADFVIQLNSIFVIDYDYSFQKQQTQLKQALEESGKKIKERTDEMQLTKQELNVKQQQDSNVVGQLKSIIIEKEAKIRSLEREVRDLRADMVGTFSVYTCQFLDRLQVLLFG
jgi:hypothetical protein